MKKLIQGYLFNLNLVENLFLVENAVVLSKADLSVPETMILRFMYFTSNDSWPNACCVLDGEVHICFNAFQAFMRSSPGDRRQHVLLLWICPPPPQCLPHWSFPFWLHPIKKMIQRSKGGVGGGNKETVPLLFFKIAVPLISLNNSACLFWTRSCFSNFNKSL